MRKAVDLFCGCGGISVGAERAGFTVIAGIDVEAKYIASFKKNFTSAKALTTDITKTPPLEFMKDVGLERGELSLLVGGPPCQGFSKNVPRKHRYLEDPKNLLVKSFLDYCEALSPEMVLMENVAEMKNGFENAYSNEVIERLESAGYVVTSVVLNAAQFGVPQRRRRAFFMANRFGVRFDPPRPTHVLSAGDELPSLFGGSQAVTVWDAISDLPLIEHGESSVEYASEPSTPYQAMMREGAHGLSDHDARRLAPLQYARLAALKPGQGHKDLPDRLKVKAGYSGAYGRLTKSMIAPTITRWVFHPGSGRWGHPVDIRTLSIREVARIQSFPDSYVFEGSYNDKAGQLGNAVPPLLAQAVLESMSTQLALRKSKRSFHSTFSAGSKKEIA